MGECTAWRCAKVGLGCCHRNPLHIANTPVSREALAWTDGCQRAAAGVMFAPLIYKHSRVEVGLLRLQQGRDRVKARMLADVFLGRHAGS